MHVFSYVYLSIPFVVNQAYKRQAETLRARGVPLKYMGCQSHTNDFPDVDLITVSRT